MVDSAARLYRYIKKSDHYPAACETILTSIAMWRSTTSSTAAELVEEADDLVDALGPDPKGQINLFVKSEPHLNYRGGVPIKDSAPRVISDRAKSDKVLLIHAIPAITRVVKACVIEYASSKSTKDMEARVRDILLQLGTGAAGLTSDFSKMDGNTCLALKESVAAVYALILQDISERSTDPFVLDAIEEMLLAVDARKISHVRMPASRNFLAAKMDKEHSIDAYVVGTVGSGDMDTTLGNFMANCMVYLEACFRVGLEPESEVFSNMAGDDGLTVGLPGCLAILKPQMEQVAAELGFDLQVDAVDFQGTGPRAQFCSMQYFVFEHEGDLVVKATRLLSRALVRFGHTVNQDVGNGLGLLRAKALCEQMWAAGVPVVQAMFTGTLARTDVSRAQLMLDNDTVYKILNTVDPELWKSPADGRGVRSRKKAIAKATALKASPLWVEPLPGMRESFADLTGIDVQTQVDLERFLEGVVKVPRVHIPDDSLRGLIRDEWL
jgi:hypothetical protein